MCVRAGEEVVRRIAAHASKVFHAARTWDGNAVSASGTASGAQAAAEQRCPNVVRSAMVQRLESDGTATFEVSASSRVHVPLTHVHSGGTACGHATGETATY